ncbi:hypothetical protein ES707_05634 [subsurface metagenome]
MNPDRTIGRIIFVDSFRAIVELSSELKSLTKSDYNDIYEIAKINSYVVIPVGQHKIIGLITKVQLSEEATTLPQKTFITLPETKRKITVTMIGTIIPKPEGKDEFKQGVSAFPTLDNPVWFITDDELDLIFDRILESKTKCINYKKDYFIPIGESPTFRNYTVKINPDKFFGKHAAILGNTGSGKSCTITALLQSIFGYKEKNGDEETFVKNAHFVILDSNGEYRNAFVKNEEGEEYKYKDLVNALYVSSDLERGGLKIPYWFMNFEDFSTLFKASERTQQPVLNMAINLAKMASSLQKEEHLLVYLMLDLQSIYSFLRSQEKPGTIKKSVYNLCDNILGYILKHESELAERIGRVFISGLKIELNKLKDACPEPLNSYNTDGIPTDNKKNFGMWYDQNIHILSKAVTIKISEFLDVDKPVHFEIEKLIADYIDQAIRISTEEGIGRMRLKENVSTLKLRIQKYIRDGRFDFIFKNRRHSSSLSLFLRYVLGQLNIYKTKDDIRNAPFGKYYEGLNIYKEKPNQVTIIDLSLLSSEVLENVAALIARLMLEFLQRIEKIHDRKKRGKFPVVLILEEAHNYIPEKRRKETDEEISVSKKVFERIAREGRKYGLGLVISSQRPSEVSKTVLAQCNSFIVHRLQNPEDQKYISQLVPSINQDLLDQLPVLPQQHAIIMGDCVRAPVQVKINEANPTPTSYDPEFFSHWIEKQSKKFPKFEEICKEWEGKVDKEEGELNEVTPDDEIEGKEEK